MLESICGLSVRRLCDYGVDLRQLERNRRANQNSGTHWQNASMPPGQAAQRPQNCQSNVVGTNLGTPLSPDCFFYGLCKLGEVIVIDRPPLTGLSHTIDDLLA